MMDQDAFLRFLECFRSHFLLEEAHLVFSQLGEIVQVVIHRSVIRLVLTAIEHHDTGITPVEGSVSLVAHIIEMIAQTDGIGIADFMVATHEEYRHLVGLHSFGQLLDEAGSLGTVYRVVDAVAVEENEIIIHILHLFHQRLESVYALVKVVEHDCSKLIFIGFWKFEGTEIRHGSISELLAVSLVRKDFGRTYTVVVFLSRQQAFDTDFMKVVVANHLSVHQQSRARQVFLVGTVFYPTVCRHGGFPHHGNSSVHRILQIRLAGENVLRFLGHTNLRHDRTMVGSHRLVHHPSMYIGESFRTLLPDGDVVNHFLRLRRRPSRLLQVVEDTVILLKPVDEIRTRLGIHVTGNDERFCLTSRNGVDDGQRQVSVLFGQSQVSATENVVFEFGHEESSLLSSPRKRMLGHLQRLLLREDTHAILTTTEADGRAVKVFHAGQLGHFAQHICLVAPLGHAVQFLNGHHIRILLQDNIGNALITAHLVHAVTVADVVGHHLQGVLRESRKPHQDSQ